MTLLESNPITPGHEEPPRPPAPTISPLKIGPYTLRSRLIVGTGKYSSLELMQSCHALSAADCVTVAVRRERIFDKGSGRNILEFIDPKKFTLLPNTAGCFNAQDAVRVARLGRELISHSDYRGAPWVKLEVLGDTKTLLPEPVGTLEATKILVNEGFSVLVYCSDDVMLCKRLKGKPPPAPRSCPPVRPSASSGQGVLNPKRHPHPARRIESGSDPDYPGHCRCRRGHGQRTFPPRWNLAPMASCSIHAADRRGEKPRSKWLLAMNHSAWQGRLSRPPASRAASPEKLLRHRQQPMGRADQFLSFQFQVSSCARRTQGGIVAISGNSRRHAPFLPFRIQPSAFSHHRHRLRHRSRPNCRWRRFRLQRS